MFQVLKALEAAQKEPKAPLSDMFTDGKAAATNQKMLACCAISNHLVHFHSVISQLDWLSSIFNSDYIHQ